ncbi:hypothetical protein IP76_13670 [Rhizobium sp. AAP43]|nr:hypothetical protein IP76_13670 [Rhizobium sp. AAP43]
MYGGRGGEGWKAAGIRDKERQAGHGTRNGRQQRSLVAGVCGWAGPDGLLAALAEEQRVQGARAAPGVATQGADACSLGAHMRGW